MPSRNVIKTYAEEHYYHVYNRGVAKQPIFLESKDKQQFLKILQRHLDPMNKSLKNDGVPYRKFKKELELLCYCLMGNHFHLLIYLKKDGDGVSKLMQSVLTAYTMFFNKKYKRVGTLFQGVFKASLISDDSYLLHITRYIHLNPRTYKTYYYSSLPDYLGERSTSWINPERILGAFESGEYLRFMEECEDREAISEELQYELADS